MIRTRTRTCAGSSRGHAAGDNASRVPRPPVLSLLPQGLLDQPQDVPRQLPPGELVVAGRRHPDRGPGSGPLALLALRRAGGRRRRLCRAAAPGLPVLLVDIDPDGASLVLPQRSGPRPLADGVHQLPSDRISGRERLDRASAHLPAVGPVPPRPLALPARALELPADDRPVPAPARRVLRCVSERRAAPPPRASAHRSLGAQESALRPGPGRPRSDHTVAPARINVRANIDALKRVGCTQVISLSAVGSLKAELPPGHFMLIDQFIDRTHGREDTFF